MKVIEILFSVENGAETVAFNIAAENSEFNVKIYISD